MSQEEVEIGSYSTGLALGDEFFDDSTNTDEKFLDPVVQQLLYQCDGLIKKPGIYAFRLQVSKIK